MKLNQLFFLFLIFIFFGCKTFKKYELKTNSSSKSIKGSFMIIRNDSIDLNNSVIVYGSVIDSLTKKPLQYAYVWVRELNLGAQTDSSGMFSLTLPAGVYRLESNCVGNSLFITDSLSFKSNSKIQVEFKLGTHLIYDDYIK